MWVCPPKHGSATPTYPAAGVYEACVFILALFWIVISLPTALRMQAVLKEAARRAHANLSKTIP